MEKYILEQRMESSTALERNNRDCQIYKVEKHDQGDEMNSKRFVFMSGPMIKFLQ